MVPNPQIMRMRGWLTLFLILTFTGLSSRLATASDLGLQVASVVRVLSGLSQTVSSVECAAMPAAGSFEPGSDQMFFSRSAACSKIRTLPDLQKVLQAHLQRFRDDAFFRREFLLCLDSKHLDLLDYSRKIEKFWILPPSAQDLYWASGPSIDEIAMDFTTTHIAEALNACSTEASTEQVIGKVGAPAKNWCAWGSTSYPVQLAHALSAIFATPVSTNITHIEKVGSLASRAVPPKDQIPLPVSGSMDGFMSHLDAGLYLVSRGTPPHAGNGSHGYLLLKQPSGQWFLMNFNDNHMEAISDYEVSQRFLKSVAMNKNSRQMPSVIGHVRFYFGRKTPQS